MRGDLAWQPGEAHSRFDPSLHRSNRLAFELNEAGGDELAVLPSTQVRKQSRWYKASTERRDRSVIAN